MGIFSLVLIILKILSTTWKLSLIVSISLSLKEILFMYLPKVLAGGIGGSFLQDKQTEKAARIKSSRILVFRNSENSVVLGSRWCYLPDFCGEGEGLNHEYNETITIFP